MLVAVGLVGYYIRGEARRDACHEALPPRAATDVKPVELCDGPSLGILIPAALLIGVLLWPDLSELGISGVVTLKRRVREQDVRQEAFESRLVMLGQQVTQLGLMAQGQAQSAAANVTVYAPDQGDVSRSIQEKEGQVRHVEGTGPQATADDPQQRARLLGEFLEEYARLEPYISFFGRRWDPDRVPALSFDQRATVAEWNEVFGEEITALRQTRNVIVHRPSSASVDTLRRALENARQLARILFDQLAST